jgi:hypothetical protein
MTSAPPVAGYGEAVSNAAAEASNHSNARPAGLRQPLVNAAARRLTAITCDNSALSCYCPRSTNGLGPPRGYVNPKPAYALILALR